MSFNVNYAEAYQKALANDYPHVLQFGRLWSTENNGKYKFVDLRRKLKWQSKKKQML